MSDTTALQVVERQQTAEHAVAVAQLPEQGTHQTKQLGLDGLGVQEILENAQQTV